MSHPSLCRRLNRWRTVLWATATLVSFGLSAGVPEPAGAESPAAAPSDETRGPARALRVDLPVDCAMGGVCTIQNYFDHDPGPGRRDYACGRLSYDGHDGTDIRVPDWPTMQGGVPVIAAADGIVVGARDGMPDVSIDRLPGGAAALEGRDAGNGVRLDHGGGWHTQYSHLLQGSVTVRTGDQVRRGDRLGLIGLSGNTVFPHVEFSVSLDGRDIDPFVGLAPVADGRFDCGEARTPLWSEAALARLDYAATGPLIAGFADRPVDFARARRGGFRETSLPLTAPALVLWVEFFGALAGDAWEMTITDPSGAVVHQQTATFDESNVLQSLFSGRRRPPEGWRPGVHRGTFRLTRDGAIVFEDTASVILR